VIILKEHPTLKSLCGNKGNETELDMSGKMNGAEDAIMLATEVVDNRAILSLNLLKNYIPTEQAKALASILKEHPTLKSLCGNSGEETELDVSGNGMDAGDATMLVPEIVDNGALSALIFSVGKYDNELITMTEADFSGKGLGVSGAMILAAFLPKCTYVPEYLFPISADTPTPTTGH
jgi:hypothetical protein